MALLKEMLTINGKVKRMQILIVCESNWSQMDMTCSVVLFPRGMVVELSVKFMKYGPKGKKMNLIRVWFSEGLISVLSPYFLWDPLLLFCII